MHSSWALLPLAVLLLAQPSAALPSFFASRKAGSNCTRHPDPLSNPPDIPTWRHALGNMNNGNISFLLKEAASGKAVAGDRLCLGVAYTVELSFGALGEGHHLLTSTYGTFSNVCPSNADECPNRACPWDESDKPTNTLTMPAGTSGAVTNVIQASWGDGRVVHGNKATYKLGPCGKPSPSPSPSPPSVRLIVRAENTSIPLSQGPAASRTRVIVRLVGYTSPKTEIQGSLTVLKVRTNGVAPPQMPLACIPAKPTLKKQSNGDYRFVATCTAAGEGRARVSVTLTEPPGLSGVTAPVNVTGLPMVG